MEAERLYYNDSLHGDHTEINASLHPELSLFVTFFLSPPAGSPGC